MANRRLLEARRGQGIIERFGHVMLPMAVVSLQAMM
jgi:hypothetical protein